VAGRYRDTRRTTACRGKFDYVGPLATISLGSIVVAGSVLLLGVLAWRSNSVGVGVIYVLVGSFFVFLPAIVTGFATQADDSPALLPGPIADAVGRIFLWSTGPLNAVGIVGAGMLIAGLVVAARSLSGRAVVAKGTP
jgi:hypothetical protein